MTTKYIVNNVSGQTITGEPILKPYKVYTALLTQSGTDTEDSINSGLLTIGVTYKINDFSIDMDFTNVGAPNNDLYTSFVATGTTPNSWGEGATYTLAYSAGAPVVTVLENTIGDIWFTYLNVGSYGLYSNGLFVNGKTVSPNSDTVNYSIVTQQYALECIYQDNDWVNIATFDPSTGSGLNDSLNSKFIEIRVYN
jgi:hypothetical protein